jgi:hypothetical protein
MTDRVILQWNMVNWITIFLMVSLGYVIIALAMQAYKQFGGGGNG